MSTNPNTFGSAAPTYLPIPDPDLIDWENPINKESPLAKGLVGFWLAGGPSWKGAKWYDLTDNKNHGTLTNMDPATDWVSDAPPGGFGSLAFASTSEYVNCGVSDVDDELTVACWLKYDNLNVSYQHGLVSQDNSNATTWWTFGINDDRLSLYCDDGVAADYNVSNGTDWDTLPVSIGWHWVAATRKANGQIRYYIDGIQDGTTQSISSGGLLNTTNVVRIHASTQYPSPNPWPMDGIYLAKRELSPSEIQAFYQESLRSYSTLLNYQSYQTIPKKRNYVSVGYSIPPFNDRDLIDWENPINEDCPLAKGLVGFWLAGDQSWKTEKWYDLSGNKNHGTLTLMDPATDWVSDAPVGGFGSLDFDGTNDYVLIESAYDSTTQISVSCWIRGGNAYEGIVSNEYQYNVSGWNLRRYNNNNIEWMTAQSGANQQTRSTVGSVPATGWVHVTATYDGGSTAKLYVNGEDVTGTPGTHLTPSSSGGLYNFEIGRFSSNSYCWTGNIANVLLFPRYLSPAEVKSHYYESLRGYPNLLRRQILQPYTNNVIRKGTYVQVPELPDNAPSLDNVDWENPINPESVFAKGLRGFYLAGGPSWRTVKWYDLSPSQNHGTLTAMDPLNDWSTNNKPTGALGVLTFGGATNEKVNLSKAVTLSSPWSIFFRAYRQNIGGDDIILGYDANNNVELTSIAAIRVRYNGNTDDFSLTNYQVWINVLLVQEGGTLKLYVDGDLKYSYANPNDSITLQNIGFNTTSTDNFVGPISEVLLWEGIIPPNIYEEVINTYPTLLNRYIEGSYAVPSVVVEEITSITLTAEGVTYTWSPQDVSLERTRIFSAESVSYSWSPQSVSFPIGLQFSAESVSYTWTPQSVNTIYNRSVSIESVNYAWSPQTTNLEYNRNLSAESASYSFSPQTVNLEYHYQIDSESVSYSFSPQSINLEYGYSLSAASVTYSWSPQDITFPTGTVLAAEGVTYLWSPQTINLEFNKLLSAESVSYSWTPQTVTLTVSSAGNFTLNAESVNYTWTPQNTNLEYNKSLIASNPSYLWTPQSVNLEQHKLISTEPPAYTWTPQTISTLYNHSLLSENVSYVWSVQNVGLEQNRVLSAEQVDYDWTPQDVSFNIGLLLSADPISYSWSVQDASLTYARKLTASPITYTWTISNITLFAGVLVPPPIIEITLNFGYTQNSILNFQHTQNKTIDFGGGQ